MLDTTLGYFLCCQSPTLFLAALLLLLCYFTRKKAHHARSVLDLILCILCAAGGVALYFLGMGKEYFSIRDFYVIRTPGWIGMLVVVAFAVWLVVRGFLALNRRRMAERRPTAPPMPRPISARKKPRPPQNSRRSRKRPPTPPLWPTSARRWTAR